MKLNANMFKKKLFPRQIYISIEENKYNFQFVCSNQEQNNWISCAVEKMDGVFLFILHKL